jgi:hypothetical protein
MHFLNFPCVFIKYNNVEELAIFQSVMKMGLPWLNFQPLEKRDCAVFIFVFSESGRGPGTVQLHRIKQLINSMFDSKKDLKYFIGNIYNKITK